MTLSKAVLSPVLSACPNALRSACRQQEVDRLRFIEPNESCSRRQASRRVAVIFITSLLDSVGFIGRNLFLSVFNKCLVTDKVCFRWKASNLPSRL